jgi:hypothetical protein
MTQRDGSSVSCRQGDGSSVCVIEGRIEMIGHIISLVIGAAIVYFAARALFKTFKNAKEGRCSSCSEDCSSCMIWDGASNK